MLHCEAIFVVRCFEGLAICCGWSEGVHICLWYVRSDDVSSARVSMPECVCVVWCHMNGAMTPMQERHEVSCSRLVWRWGRAQYTGSTLRHTCILTAAHTQAAAALLLAFEVTMHTHFGHFTPISCVHTNTPPPGPTPVPHPPLPHPMPHPPSCPPPHSPHYTAQ